MNRDNSELEIIALQLKLLETNAVLIEAWEELLEYEKMLGSIVGDTHQWDIQKLRRKIVNTICNKTEEYK